MAERIPSPSRPSRPPLLPVPSEPNYTSNNSIQAQTELQLATFSPGTYVVQVPKDQIYRVPPQENARLAQIRRNSIRKNVKRTRCVCLVVLFIFIAAALVAGALLGGLFSIFSRVKDPRFTIVRFGLKNNTQNPVYNVSLHVYNPNSKVNILYKDGGQVSLSLGQEEIGSGTYPSFRQSHGNTTVVGMALKGTKKELGKEIEKSKPNTVKLGLNISVPTTMKLGTLRSGTLKYNVTCQLTVDKLAEGSRVISQQCQTERQ